MKQEVHVHVYVWPASDLHAQIGMHIPIVNVKIVGILSHDILTRCLWSMLVNCLPNNGFHDIFYTHTVNCGPIPSPPGGYVSPYSNTLEGATVMFTYMCGENQNGHSFSMNETAVCNQDGNWEPNPANISICEKSPGIIQYHLIPVSC